MFFQDRHANVEIFIFPNLTFQISSKWPNFLTLRKKKIHFFEKVKFEKSWVFWKSHLFVEKNM